MNFLFNWKPFITSMFGFSITTSFFLSICLIVSWHCVNCYNVYSLLSKFKCNHAIIRLAFIHSIVKSLFHFMMIEFLLLEIVWLAGSHERKWKMRTDLLNGTCMCDHTLNKYRIIHLVWMTLSRLKTGNGNEKHQLSGSNHICVFFVLRTKLFWC